ncbi:hypothetical protein LF41_131 [Lysobacter dokdonensis DS-58]|uniref:Transmembrane protein n=1 Tax=Lysobacter dokdonensis DS-58 TaxID=1300345 RepID=A0A0A2X1E7_9GAMM|nr:hypothetical protein [Lysobacter dokdonensis]KGQ19039.1 hypothetical protein LF41_131 [Lysobacter dokdonensis DS-58]
MRIFVAGLIGGIVLFLWGVVAHVVLPIGEMGMKVASNQDSAMTALRASTDKGAGVYMIPGMDPAMWQDKEAMNAFTTKYKDAPSAFVVWDPTPNQNLQTMGPALTKQFVNDVLIGLLAAWILAMAPVSFGRRVLMGGVLGVLAWLATSVPYWNWYRFPMDFTVGALLDSGLGLLIASAPIAWWLGRGR